MKHILEVIEQTKQRTNAARATRIRLRHITPLLTKAEYAIRRQYGDKVLLPATRKFMSMLKPLIRQQGYEHVHDVLMFVITNWPRLRLDAFKKWSNVPDYPVPAYICTHGVWGKLEQVYRRDVTGDRPEVQVGQTYSGMEKEVQQLKKQLAEAESKARSLSAEANASDAAKRKALEQLGRAMREEKSTKNRIASTPAPGNTAITRLTTEIGLLPAELAFAEKHNAPVHYVPDEKRTEKFYAWEMLP